MCYNSESKNDRDNIFGGPCRPFLVLSKARCPHIKILPGKNSACLEFSVPCYIHTLYNGANEYQTGLWVLSEIDKEYIFGGPCRPFLVLSKACCPHFEISHWRQSACFEFPVPYYIRCILVRPNIKMGYNSESYNDRNYIFGGPCRPFLVLSKARCPHFEIFPGKNPHGWNFPFHAIYTRCVIVQTNIKRGYE